MNLEKISHPEDQGSSLVSIAGFIKSSQADLWSLTLLAMNINHKVIHRSNGWEIMVGESDFSLAKEQIDKLEKENHQWPPARVQPEPAPGLDFTTFLFMAGLVAFYNTTGPWQLNKWFKHGALVPYRIFEKGEWWRIITSLTLHADIVHLIGNIALGGLVITYLVQQTGPGAAWGLALFSGFLGNFLNAFFHESHQSIGFSTVVFGVIGILCGLKISKKEKSLKGVILPLGAGFGLLALLGTEGERTDLGAHIWGMASGVILGFIYHKIFKHEAFSPSQQIFISVLTGAVVCWAWIWGLSP